ncbi:MAG: 4Fe-4S dicluster domain-containing protein, partial [Coriobacteriales bacterium]|nr:4Fe-4S dicluster domain-containing protein [Coriobacteriales bacterium]
MLLKQERMTDLLGALAQQARVYVPAREQNGTATRFALYQQGSAQGTAPAFDAVNTLMPPKDLLFPQTQKMYRYGCDAEGNAFIDASHDADEVVLFGLRSCDARSIECMDDVFLTKGYDDELYGARRALLTTVAIGCVETAETCFCDSMGLDPNTAPSADIQLNASTDGSVYLVAAQTEKGAAALEAWRPFLDDGGAPGGADAAAGAAATGVGAGVSPQAGSPQAEHSACTLKVDATGIKEKLDRMFEHPIWDEVAKKCLTCGTCTFVCPTCHCFDISQENRMQEGERFRCWDSCMFSSYTEMAGHH